MKAVIKILAILMVVSALAVAAIFGPYVLRVQHFQASPADGYYADFYLYIPSSISNEEQLTILVQPNNSGTNSDDLQVHRKDAWWTGFERKSIADELGVVLLVPAFIRPGTDWQIYTHALDRDSLTTEREDIKRIDLQLIAMIDRARSDLADQGIQTDEKVFIQGFSASAMFANRFTVLHPDRVKAATIGSPGGWPIAPIAAFDGQQLNYPAGIADLESLTRSSFDSAAYNAVPQLIYMGSTDDNDSLDFTDGWDEADAKVVDTLFGADPLSRWEDAKAIYLESGANVEFLLIDGIGHDRKALQTYSTEFFKKILNK
jgi:dienelactone hydrolase